jgi:hypothetical protein
MDMARDFNRFCDAALSGVSLPLGLCASSCLKMAASWQVLAARYISKAFAAQMLYNYYREN